MRLPLRLVIVITVFTVVVLLSLSVFLLPSVKPETAAQDEFSSERAMKHVVKIASTIHTVGSPAQKEARDYIINEISAMGFNPEVQKGYGENDSEGFMGFVPYAGELENIYFRIKGSGDTGQDILMLAHYDSTLGGPGAADDVSGVAVLLEMARALASETALKNDIVVLFTDGEEAELLGSKLFTQNSEVLKNVCLTINFEARGNRGPSILFETSDKNDWLMNEFLKAVPYPLVYSFTSDVYKIVSNITDFTPFLDAGKSGLNLANLGGMETYHNPQDTPENLDKGFLQHQGSYAVSLARHFGNLPLDNVKSSHNAVFFTLARSVAVSYSDQWTVPLTILELILLAFVLFIGLRRQYIFLKGIISGFFISLLSIVAAAGLGLAVQVLFKGIYYKLDSVLSISDLVDLRRTLIFNGNIWIVATLILSALILFVLQRLFRRKLSGCNMLIGNILVFAMLAVVFLFVLQGIGYIFLWPLMLSLTGLLIDFVVGRRIGQKYILSFITSTFACVLIYIPIGYLLFEALTMLNAVISITILSIPLGFVILNTSLFVGNTKDLGRPQPSVR